MDQRMPETLDKILALADSGHEGEAVVAVRKARQMLSRGGLSFGDLARAAFSPRKAPGVVSFLTGQRHDLEAHIEYLQKQIEDLQAQMQTQDLQLDFWRRRARDMEETLKGSATTLGRKA